MESRIHGDMYVRFGGRLAETYHRKVAKRCGPSLLVESADFFRIQNITLGYSLRNIKMGNYTLPGIRFSLTADRPFTTFKANSFTPELSDAEGWDTEVYPLTSTYSFGIQIDF